jgi:hypothetical protein
VYPDPRVADLIESNFIPVRFHIKEQPTMWRRFDVRWTPTILVLAPDGTERYRIEGYLPADEILARLHLALGYTAVARKKWEVAEREFTTAAEEFPDTEVAPEGMYWAGVSRYSASHDAAELKALRKALESRYPDTSWATRASVWGR